MTPALNAVYEELLQRAASPPFDEAAHDLRRAFSRRTGALPPEHPGRSARDAASWEEVLVAHDLGRAIASTFDDPAERSLALVFSRAQRGVFQPVLHGRTPCVRELWAGGEFVLIGRDEIGRAMAEVQDSTFLGRIVAGSDGCAVLPGRIWLPEEALPFLPELVAEARARGMDIDTFSEALLRMEHSLTTMSRVKPRYAFRPEALNPPAERK